MGTDISWTDETWNPVTGCSPISEGCRHCYAEKQAAWLAGMDRSRVRRGLKPRTGYPLDQPFKVTLHPDRLERPFKWRKPRVVFVCSMSDLFHRDIPDEFRWQIFQVMMDPRNRKHLFLALTKRAQEMGLWVARLARSSDWPAPNIWFGVTTENQRTAEERIPHLLRAKVAKRFISAEPLLGGLVLDQWLYDRPASPAWPQGLPGLDWVIPGGETGPRARVMRREWVSDLFWQCQAAKVPFHFKSWGAWGDKAALERWAGAMAGKEPMPRRDSETGLWLVGKKFTGRELAGRTWDEMPEWQEAA